MRLKVGDKIYSKVSSSGLTLDRAYVVTKVRDKTYWTDDDICILDDSGLNWWFGQIGETECGKEKVKKTTLKAIDRMVY